MIRKWTSKLRRSVRKRAVSKRRGSKIPITISFEPDKTTGNLGQAFAKLSTRGETSDLSETGIGFVVSSIRLREFYLVGEGRVLNAQLNLPEGKVKIQLMGQSYKQIGQSVSNTQYLVGAKILRMSEGDRLIYNEFLKGKRPEGGALELGIDEG